MLRKIWKASNPENENEWVKGWSVECTTVHYATKRCDPTMQCNRMFCCLAFYDDNDDDDDDGSRWINQYIFLGTIYAVLLRNSYIMGLSITLMIKTFTTTKFGTAQNEQNKIMKSRIQLTTWRIGTLSKEALTSIIMINELYICGCKTSPQR